MSKRKKRTKKYHPREFNLAHKSTNPIPEEVQASNLNQPPKPSPNTSNYTGKQGKSQDTQNLRRGDR